MDETWMIPMCVHIDSATTNLDYQTEVRAGVLYMRNCDYCVLAKHAVNNYFCSLMSGNNHEGWAKRYVIWMLDTPAGISSKFMFGYARDIDYLPC